MVQQDRLSCSQEGDHAPPTGWHPDHEHPEPHTVPCSCWGEEEHSCHQSRIHKHWKSREIWISPSDETVNTAISTLKGIICSVAVVRMSLLTWLNSLLRELLNHDTPLQKTERDLLACPEIYLFFLLRPKRFLLFDPKLYPEYSTFPSVTPFIINSYYLHTREKGEQSPNKNTSLLKCIGGSFSHTVKNPKHRLMWDWKERCFLLGLFNVNLFLFNKGMKKILPLRQ